MDNIAIFLGQSTYHVFDELVFCQCYHACRVSSRHALAAQASVKLISIFIDSDTFREDQCEPLLQALRDGTYVPPSLTRVIRFSTTAWNFLRLDIKCLVPSLLHNVS